MLSKQIKKITTQLVNHERRLVVLEKSIDISVRKPSQVKKKQTTLREIVKGREFKNGQEKVAVIVGYYEKFMKKANITENDIKKGWIKGKLSGKYRTNLLERAAKDGLVRDLENKNYDLSQSGEKFFKKFINSNDNQN